MNEVTRTPTKTETLILGRLNDLHEMGPVGVMNDRDIAELIGASRQAANYHKKQLIRKGLALPAGKCIAFNPGPPPTTAVRDGLTERQREVLHFMTRYQAKQGMPPTLREIQTHFGMKSPNSVMCHLRLLLKKGVIIHDQNNTARAWRLPVDSSPKVCPHCGGSL